MKNLGIFSVRFRGVPVEFCILMWSNYAAGLNPFLNRFAGREKTHNRPYFRTIGECSHNVAGTQYRASFFLIYRRQIEKIDILSDSSPLREKVGNETCLSMQHSPGRVGKKWFYSITKGYSQYTIPSPHN